MHGQGIQKWLKGGLALFLLLTFYGGSLFISPQAHGAVQATYYVSPTGSDSNSGTSINSPFATIDHARQVVEGINGSMTGDIVVYLLGGTYTLNSTIAFTPRDSGTNGHQIFYELFRRGVKRRLLRGLRFEGRLLRELRFEGPAGKGDTSDWSNAPGLFSCTLCTFLFNLSWLPLLPLLANVMGCHDTLGTVFLTSDLSSPLGARWSSCCTRPRMVDMMRHRAMATR